MGEKITREDFDAMPAAARISLRRFGQRSRLRLNDITLVAATAQIVANNDPDRLSLLIQNTGTANPATITADGGRTIAQGDVLGSGGNSYVMDALTDGEACGREAWGISTAGTTIHVEEIVGYGPVVELPPGITPL